MFFKQLRKTRIRFESRKILWVLSGPLVVFGLVKKMRPLSAIIEEEIRKSGRISFRRFVDLCLFHPKHGYYSSGKAGIGKKGDFYTAPSVHRSFGQTISRFITKASSLLDGEKIGIFEFGASGGRLAFDILEDLRERRPDVYARVEYLISEISPSANREAKETLKSHGDKVRWIKSPQEIVGENFQGIVIANEFLDSLPFHRLKFQNGKVKEVFLSLRDGKIEELLVEPETEEIKRFSNRYLGDYQEGEETEACPLAVSWLCEVEKILSRGFILTIDYGFLSPELYSPKRRKGTWRCFYRHELSSDPYSRVGEQDITADVNFSELITAGDSLGLVLVKYATQGQFLVDWGILEIFQKYEDPKYEEDRLAIKTLFMPEFMGSRFKVLLQSKGLSSKKLSDFYQDGPFRITPPAV